MKGFGGKQILCGYKDPLRFDQPCPYHTRHMDNPYSLLARHTDAMHVGRPVKMRRETEDMSVRSRRSSSRKRAWGEAKEADCVTDAGRGNKVNSNDNNDHDVEEDERENGDEEEQEENYSGRKRV